MARLQRRGPCDFMSPFIMFPPPKTNMSSVKKPDDLFSIAQGGQSISSGDCSVCPHQTLFGKGSSAYLLALWNGWCWFRTKGSFDLFCRSEIPLKVSFHLWPSCFFFVSLSFFCLLHPRKVTFKAPEKFLVGIWNFEISSWNGPFPRFHVNFRATFKGNVFWCVNSRSSSPVSPKQ